MILKNFDSHRLSRAVLTYFWLLVASQYPLEQHFVFIAFPDKGKVFSKVEITALVNFESHQ